MNLDKFGQTIIEYMFLTFVLIGIFLSIGQRIRDYLIGKTAECPNDSFICRLVEKIQGEGALGGNFRYYRVKR